MRHQWIRTITGIWAVLLVGACTSHPPTEVPVGDKLAEMGFTLGEQVKRISNFQVNSWNVVDRRHAILHVGANRRYLITTRSPCDGLEDTQNLQYSTTAGNLTDKDKLLVRRTTGRMESCFIDTLHTLEKTTD